MSLREVSDLLQQQLTDICALMAHPSRSPAAADVHVVPKTNGASDVVDQLVGVVPVLPSVSGAGHTTSRVILELREHSTRSRIHLLEDEEFVQIGVLL